jgi:hypothetical protein
MSEPTSDLCAAFGCPLMGTFGVNSKWYCACHFNANPSLNDAITAELHRQKATVDRIVLARREHRADAQLENGLILLVREIGTQQTFHGAGVIGPESGTTHYSEPRA